MEGNFQVSQEEREKAWQTCRDLLREARTLLMADPNYLRREAMDIYKAAYAYCSGTIFGAQASGLARLPGAQVAIAGQPDPRADRAYLGIAADEDLTATLDRYAEQVMEARHILRAAKLA
jgi:hypothetical protein